MTEKRESLDGAERRRIYLFRHGAVDYVDANGKVVDDPDGVSLNERGRAEADAMREVFGEVHVDRVICSGLKRTRETAGLVMQGRSCRVEVESGLEEIRPATDRQPDYDLFSDVAYGHWSAGEVGRRFLGGEQYADFYARITAAIEDIVADGDWHTVAVFAHGGTNAAILGWVMGLELNAFGLVDQATCCLNIIDLDTDRESGAIRRKVVRGMNITAIDPAKRLRSSGDMEALARYLMEFQR